MQNPLSFTLKPALISLLLLSGPLLAQKSGQSVQIQYGVVVGSKYVQQKSNAGKGALVGGTILKRPVFTVCIGMSYEIIRRPWQC